MKRDDTLIAKGNTIFSGSGHVKIHIYDFFTNIT